MYLVTWIHVRDYDDWKMVFDGGESLRTRHRCTGHEIYRDVDDTDQLTVFLEFPSRETAKAYMADPELSRRMEESGVDSEIRSMFVTQTQRVDYRSARAA